MVPAHTTLKCGDEHDVGSPSSFFHHLTNLKVPEPQETEDGDPALVLPLYRGKAPHYATGEHRESALRFPWRQPGLYPVSALTTESLQTPVSPCNLDLIIVLPHRLLSCCAPHPIRPPAAPAQSPSPLCSHTLAFLLHHMPSKHPTQGP